MLKILGVFAGFLAIVQFAFIGFLVSGVYFLFTAITATGIFLMWPIYVGAGIGVVISIGYLIVASLMDKDF